MFLIYLKDEADDDEDDEENAKSTFYNDLFKLDLETYKWKQLVLKLLYCSCFFFNQ